MSSNNNKKKKSPKRPSRPKPSKCHSLAVLGTMSDAGKTCITAGICRILSNGGTSVAPFKGQNMSNNAAPALLPDISRRERLYQSFGEVIGEQATTTTTTTKSQQQGYGEIGTAQALQAEACRLVPRVEMNPILLKSGGRNKRGESLCSVVVLGKEVVRETYGDLGKRTTSLKKMVLDSHTTLAKATGADVIVMEGAGSCTELNLMDRDVVNLPLVRQLGCPWILVANIDCGGVFAQIVGTKMCVSDRDWSLCVGIIVNKLRGEVKYFEPGPKILENMVKKPIYVVPFLDDLNLPEEDGMGIERRLAQEGNYSSTSEKNEKPLVVVIAYPHVAMTDDICPLENDPRFRVQWRRSRLPKTYPHTTAVILPGSRITRLDLKWLQDSGWAAFIKKHVSAGGAVLGICGGYQMLGWTITDPTAVEGQQGAKQALGLLPLVTTIEPAECKIISPQRGKLFKSQIPVTGFELHCGRSKIVAQQQQTGSVEAQKINPLLLFESGRPEGMSCGKIKGTYLHGLLRTPKARVDLLVPEREKFPNLVEDILDPLDRLAKHLESCGLDHDTLVKMIGIKKR